MYIIQLYSGFAFAWGIQWILVLVDVFSGLIVLAAIREEQAMKEK